MSKSSFTNPIKNMAAVVDTALIKNAKREKGKPIVAAEQTVMWQAFYNASTL